MDVDGTTTLAAARDGHVVLSAIAALLDRNDDEDLYGEVMGNAGMQPGHT